MEKSPDRRFKSAKQMLSHINALKENPGIKFRNPNDEVDVKAVKKAKKAKRKIDGERQKWFLFLFTGTNKDVNLRIQKKPEFIRFRWAEPQKAPFLIVPFKKQVYEQVLAEFMPVVEKL